MDELLKNDWKEALAKEFDQPYYQKLMTFLSQEYKTKQIFPPREDVFNALHYTALKDVKVLIIGQDPYHGLNQAHGLSFSVLPGQKIPPSLRNIYRELEEDLGFPVPNHGYLKKWAEEGVLLLNAVLTVQAHEANSHKGIGWEEFTDAIIRVINAKDQPLVVFLWGKPAQLKEKMLDNPNHLVLKASHPSPLSSYRGFFGSKPFSKANNFLKASGIEEVDWLIEDIVT